MRFFGVSIYLLASSYAISAGATAPLHKSKEDEALSAIQSLHHASSTAARLPKGGPPQLKAFMERKKNRRDLSKMISKSLKDALIGELVGGDSTKSKGGVKAKVARFLFNQKKNKVLNKMKRRNAKEDDENADSSHRRTSQISQYFPWMKEPSPPLPPSSNANVKISEQEVADTSSFDHDDDPYYYYNPLTLFDILDQISSTMTSINQTEYTEVVEGLTSLIGEATNITIPSPEGFCADFNVTTTEEECVAAVSSVVTLVEGAIQAPWLIRDIVGYVEAWVNEVVSWETVEGIAGGIMSMYGADGTIDGGLGAIRGVVSDVYALIAAIDPYVANYYPELADMGGLFFDLLPLTTATDILVWNFNMLENFGDDLYDTAYGLVEGIEYTLGQGYIDMPEGPEFHADVCELFGLVPASVTAVVSCNYFGDVGQEDLVTENIDFCVEPDQNMEDYTAELFTMESTFDVSTLYEMESTFWIVEDLKYKFGDYDFSALESMTCSIKGRLTRPLLCNEKPLNTFLFKDGGERTCKWLRSRKHTDKICENFETARYACPSTCCMCEEDPKGEFFRRYVEGDGVKVPEMKTCKWLSSRTPENLEKFCQKNFAPPGLNVASGACPVTCGFCEARDECQEAIESYLTYNGYFYHYDYETFEYVFGDFFLGSQMTFYATDGVYNLGYYTGRDGNTFSFVDGDDCGGGQFSSTVIFESSKDVIFYATSVNQTSNCTFEMRTAIPCYSSSYYGDDAYE